MKGFKSFARQTVVTFDPKLSGVVGRNGSGKSNILDAISFVLGIRAMSVMRAKRGAELIYNGGPKGVSAPFAQVKIALDNSQKIFGKNLPDRVIISRKVNTEGNSVYRINGKRTRREDVLGFLAEVGIMPDGYNLVPQGHIDAIFEMNPREFRGIIDEIAGIQFYEDHKHEAMLHLDEVKRRIEDVNVLIFENDRKLERLKRERDAAKKYFLLKEAKAKYGRTRLKLKQEDLENLMKQLEESVKAKEKEIGEKEIQAKEAIVLLEKAKTELDSVASSLLHAQSEELAPRVKEVETKAREVLELEAQLQSKNEDVKERRKEQESLRKEEEAIRKITLPQSAATSRKLRERLNQVESDRKELEETRKGLSERLRRATETISGISHQVEESRNKLREYTHSLENQSSENELVRKQFETLSGDEKRIRNELDGFKEDKSRLETDKGALLSSRLSGLETDVAALKSEEDDLRTALFALGSREDGLSKLKDALNSRSKALTAISKRMTAEGIGSDDGTGVILAKDSEDAVALASQASSAGLYGARITTMKSASAGVMPKIISKPSDAAIAMPMNDGDGYFVTQDGRVLIDAKASTITIGAELDGIPGLNNAVHVIEAAELPAIRREKKTLEEKVKTNSAKQSGTNGEISRTNREIDEVSIALRRIIEEISGREQALGVIFHKKSQAEERMQELEREISRLQAGVNESRESLNAVELERKKALESMPSDSEREELDSHVSRLTDESRRLNLEAKAAISRIRNDLVPKLSELRLGLKDALRKEEAEKELLSGIEKSLVEVRASKARAEKEAAAVRKSTEELLSSKTALEERFKSIQAGRYEAEGSAGSLRAELAHISSQISSLKQERDALLQELGGSSDFFNIITVTMKRCDKQLKFIDEKLTALGAVNQRALEEYDSQIGRYSLMEDKRKLLDSERESILDFMEKIEKRKKESFMESFNSIAGNFSNIYHKLTGCSGGLFLEEFVEEHTPPLPQADGGSAHLHTKDEFAMLGVSMRASVTPGQTDDYRRIELMSGGEKVITALAFIFALQEHLPASFYVFDEVDAALDKANSDKLSRLLSERSLQSQIIVITHNDSVINACDHLVGVEMNAAKGSSSIVTATSDFLRKTRLSFAAEERDKAAA